MPNTGHQLVFAALFARLLLCVADEQPPPLKENDLSAWKDFFAATNGESWTCCQTRYATPCECSGVTCSNNTLVRIQLSDCNLSGSIPASFSTLSSLQTLEIANNAIGGSLPDLGGLLSLQDVDFSNNMFTGQIPRNLSLLSNLQRFFGDNNDLLGTIPPIGLMSNLQFFSLSGNSLSGNIPVLSTTTKLNVINLGDNLLEGSIPDLPPSLQYVLLHHNLLTGTIPSLALTRDLVILDLADNYLIGTIPQIDHLSVLVGLSLFKNRLTGTLPDLPASLVSPLYSKLILSPFILVHDNFLSCNLPRTPAGVTTLAVNRTVLVSPGNEFSDTHLGLPGWLTQERNASPLFVQYPELGVIIGVGVGGTLLVLPIVVYAVMRWLGLVQLSQLWQVLQPALPQVAKEDASLAVIGCSIRVMLVLFAFTIVSLLPCYLTSKRLFQCGDSLSKATVAYVYDSPTEQPISVFLVVVSMLTAGCVAWLFGFGREVCRKHGVQLSRRPAKCWRDSWSDASAQMQHSESRDFYDHQGQQLAQPPQPFRYRLRSSLLSVLPIIHNTGEPSSFVSCWGMIGYRLKWVVVFVLWSCGLVVMSLPAIICELFDALPHDLSFHLPGDKSVMIQLAAVPLLALTSSVLVPSMCNILVGIGMANDPRANRASLVPTVRDNSTSTTQMTASIRVKLVTRLTLVTRLMLLIIVPALVVLIMDNRCMQHWKSLWQPCSGDDATTFDSSFELPSLSGLVEQRIERTQVICTPHFDTDQGQCPRRIIEFSARLLLAKMLFQAFVVPILSLAWHGFVRPRCFPFLRSLRFDDAGLITLTWVEVGIVYGGFAPLMNLAVVLALVTHRWMYRILANAASQGLVDSPQPSTVSPPFAYLCLAVITQTALSVWLFAAANLSWKLVVLCGFPIVTCLLCLHISTRMGSMVVACVFGPVLTPAHYTEQTRARARARSRNSRRGSGLHENLMGAGVGRLISIAESD